MPQRAVFGKHIADRRPFARNLADGERISYTSHGLVKELAPLLKTRENGSVRHAHAPYSGRAILRSLSRLIAAAVTLLGAFGCTSPPHYPYSPNGHLNVMASRRNVERLIADPSTPEALRAQMVSARLIRQFASDELGLPDNTSYRSYADVGQEAVTWAVFAAPEFSLTPHTWCFPVFGCVPYRGYFSKTSAIETAADLQKQGFEVYVTGVTAYSTLGWSSDPLVSTMFTQDQTYLAGLVFHELAHQRVYVRDDSAFNEAFAVAVETSGVRKWLRSTGDFARLRRYEAERLRRIEFLALVSRARGELMQVYASSGTVKQKRAAKAATIERLRARYRALRDDRWHGYGGYDAWFDAPINNARLAAVSVYSDQAGAFLRLLDLCSGNHRRFYAAVEKLATVDKAVRANALMSADSCSVGDGSS